MREEKRDKIFFPASDRMKDTSIDACSATDCTGLIPALPMSESELDAYDELYSFLPKAARPRNME